MKLIAQVRLYPTEEQATYLLQTLEEANAACNRISRYAWENHIFRQYDLHKALYHAVRAETRLAAQIVVRCTAKVADAYKLDKKSVRTFRPHGAIAYDDRILNWYTDKHEVSIWSVGNRLQIPYQTGERQYELIQSRQGETDLVYRHEKFYLLAVCDIPDPDERDVDTALGIDLGVVNIATTSDGETQTSAGIERNRLKHQRLRTQLQSIGTKSSRRHLKKLAGKQARFQKDVNHCISKHLVSEAERTNRAIALEELTGIRSRTRVKGKEQRAKHSNWAFAQLRAYITYKAKLAGIPLVLVNPAYTSQRCYGCGHTERANRRSQAEFLCVECGYSNHADHNASLNIAKLAWAAIRQPIVSTHAPALASGTSSRL
ncbi:MAG: transposase [Chloroflexota bacterium]